ncbi:MAG: MurR/RpiR family transcriptional regulator [Lactovum sp.]
MGELSNSESYTWQVIQDNYHLISEMSIMELAELAHVSISTVTRTLQKKGFSGYTEFRYSVKEKSLNEKTEFSSEVQAAISKNEEELLKTINGISAKSIEEAVELMDKAEEIIIFASGLSVNVADEMKRKLHLWHKHVRLYSEREEMAYYAKSVNESTLLVILSLQGERQEMLDSVEKVKLKQAKTLAITASVNSRLSQMVDLSISGYKSKLEVSYFELDVHSRLPLYILVRVLFDAYSIYKKAQMKKFKINKS